MRLINADELIVMEYGGIKFIPAEFINDAPTIDAVPVVRCKDCKNSRGKIANRTKCGIHNWWVGFDYFCADGERMKGGKDDEMDHDRQESQPNIGDAGVRS